MYIYIKNSVSACSFCHNQKRLYKLIMYLCRTTLMKKKIIEFFTVINTCQDIITKHLNLIQMQGQKGIFP